MPRTFFLLSGLVSFACVMGAQPVISPDGVLNAASNIPTGLPNSGIAQGAMFVVYGSNLGPAQLRLAGSLPLLTSLGGASVSVTSGALTRPAFLVYASATQVAAVLPSTMPVGDATVTVSYGGQASLPARIQIVRSAFGIFTRNQGGTGPGITQNWVSPTTIPTTNSLIDAAAPGQVEILWGTGLGPISGDDSSAPAVGNLDADVEVLIGGRSARLLYKGRSPEFPGLDQVQFEVPAGVQGCYVPVAVRTESKYSNYATMAIASNGRYCANAVSFTSTELQSLEAAGAVRVGIINLNHVIIMAAGFPDQSSIEEGRANFYRRDLNEALSALSPAEDWWTAPLLAEPGSCMVYSYRTSNEAGDFTPIDPIRSAGLKAGSALGVSGPKGTKQIPLRNPALTSFKTTLGGSAANMPDYLDPGDYVVNNGSGGVDVPGFRANLRIPAGLVWTNRDAIRSIQRATGLTLTWSAADPESELVTIAGVSVRTDSKVRASFICSELASAGRFTVPAGVLASLPASSPSSGVVTEPSTGMLMLGASRPSRFTPAGIDIGIISYSTGTFLMVPFQ